MALEFALLVVLLACLPMNLLIPCAKRKKVMKSKNGRHSGERSKKCNVNAGLLQDEHNLRSHKMEKLPQSAGPSSKDSGAGASAKQSQKAGGQPGDDSDPLKSAPMTKKKADAPGLKSKKDSGEEKTDLRSLPSESEVAKDRRKSRDGDIVVAKPAGSHDDNAQTAMPGKAPTEDNAATAMPGKIPIDTRASAPVVAPGKLVTCEEVVETQVHQLPTATSDEKNVQLQKPKNPSAENTQSEKDDPKEEEPKKTTSPLVSPAPADSNAVPTMPAPVTTVLPAPTQAPAPAPTQVQSPLPTEE